MIEILGLPSRTAVLSGSVLEEEVDSTSYYRASILHLSAGARLIPSEEQFGAFYVLGGQVRVTMQEARLFGVDEGWLSLPSQSQRIEAEEESRLFAVSNTAPLPDAEITNRSKNIPYRIDILHGLGDYTVNKPWGFEKWFVDSDAYVFKGIRMNAGSECSLQLHEQKVEVNLVLSGRAQLVLGEDTGITAAVKLCNRPRDDEVDAVISRIVPVIIDLGGGWKAGPYQIHQIKSLETYFALEVSSSHVDDIIRLRDLTNRPGGRIASEHLQRS